MPVHTEFGPEKADTRHQSLDPVTAAMEAEARAQAAETADRLKPTAPPATLIAQRARPTGVVRLG